MRTMLQNFGPFFYFSGNLRNSHLRKLRIQSQKYNLIKYQHFYILQLQEHIKMGQQITKSGRIINHNPSASNWNGQLSCKTSFHYIHPLKCEIQQNLHMEEQALPEIDNKTHEAEYWEIQNNVEQPSVNSVKDLEKIDEIKVKWNQFIKMKKKNYLEDYSVLKQIGRGGFGCVHKVKARYTGLYRAAKRIKKAQLKKSEHQKLFEQMAIMMSLDHPNIAKLYQVYDYKSYYVLILELCEGGELFKKIVTKQLNEEISAKVMKQILWTLIYLHKKGIVHRDLKPENMLFQSDSDTLKIIDFGIAVKKKPDQVLNARLGTPYYIAPEVLCKNYGEKCDIWSAGVILFMMISGYPPFRGQNQYEVMQNVLKQTVQFKGSIWNKVSTECKSLISSMLKKSPDERPTAQQAFTHPWIKRVVQKVKGSKDQDVISNIRGFSFENKLQAVVYTYIVSQLLTSEQKKFLFQTFKQLDKNNDGVIESNELYEALKAKKDINEERVKFLMRIIDTNGSGHIDYTEFLVAGLDPKNSLNQHHFQQAFQYFDIDHSGAITFEQIAFFLQDTKQSEESIKKIFQQVDQNNDGNISKEEFVKLLMQQTKKKMKSLESLKSVDTETDIKNTNNKTPNKDKDPPPKTKEKTQALTSKNGTTIKPPTIQINMRVGMQNKSAKQNKTPSKNQSSLSNNLSQISDNSQRQTPKFEKTASNPVQTPKLKQVGNREKNAQRQKPKHENNQRQSRKQKNDSLQAMSANNEKQKNVKTSVLKNKDSSLSPSKEGKSNKKVMIKV